MRSLAALDLYFLKKEFAPLDGARLDKIYQPSKEELLIQVHKEGKYLLRVLVGSGVFLSSSKNIGEQLTFAKFLRKQLGNARVTIVQKHFERVLEFQFESKEKRVLIVELFSRGNVILCDAEYKILGVLQKQQFKDRKVEAGQVYTYPPAEHLDIVSASESEIQKRILTSSRDSLVKTLAIEFGLGGVYAEEVCVRAGVAKDTAKVSRDGAEKVAKTVKELLDEPLNPVKTPKGVFPIMMQSLESVPIDSFSAALEHEFLRDSDPSQKEREKLLKAIAAQEARIKEVEREIEAERRKGELIYEQYAFVQELLNTPMDKLKKFSQVKSVDFEKKKVVVEL